MDFKYLITAIIICNACQQNEPEEPEPFLMNTPVLADTAYTPNKCNTSGWLRINNSDYFYVSSQTVTSVSTPSYTKFYYANLSSDFLEIYFKRQSIAPKNFTIIPYNTNFKFNNYHEAMIRIYVDYYGDYYHSKSGTLNLYSLYTVGFCDFDFINASTGLPDNFSFTY